MTPAQALLRRSQRRELRDAYLHPEWVARVREANGGRTAPPPGARNVFGTRFERWPSLGGVDPESRTGLPTFILWDDGDEPWRVWLG